MQQLFGTFAIILMLGSTRVRAEERSPVESANLSIKLTVGLGGTVDAISSASTIQAGSALSSESTGSRSRVSYGVAAQYTLPALRHFAIGAALGYLSWRGARGNDIGARNWLLDLAALPEGRWKVGESVLLYATLPVGLTMDVLNEVVYGLGDGDGDDTRNPGFGFLVGGLLGARFQVMDRLGLFGELGYVYRSVSHELPAITFAGGLRMAVREDVTVAFGQLTLSLGACLFF